jgi:hypothetical protein
MREIVKRFATAMLVAAAAAGSLLWSGEFAPRDIGGFVSTAQAVRGAPATPVSYAGVARRSVRTPALGWGTAVGIGGPAGLGQ